MHRYVFSVCVHIIFASFVCNEWMFGMETRGKPLKSRSISMETQSNGAIAGTKKSVLQTKTKNRRGRISVRDTKPGKNRERNHVKIHKQ